MNNNEKNENKNMRVLYLSNCFNIEFELHVVSYNYNSVVINVTMKEW
jgi:hypothetical protein